MMVIHSPVIYPVRFAGGILLIEYTGLMSGTVQPAAGFVPVNAKFPYHAHGDILTDRPGPDMLPVKVKGIVQRHR